MHTVRRENNTSPVLPPPPLFFPPLPPSLLFAPARPPPHSRARPFVLRVVIFCSHVCLVLVASCRFIPPAKPLGKCRCGINLLLWLFQLIGLYGEDARLFLLECLVEETGFKEQRPHSYHGNKDAQKVRRGIDKQWCSG